MHRIKSPSFYPCSCAGVPFRCPTPHPLSPLSPRDAPRPYRTCMGPSGPRATLPGPARGWGRRKFSLSAMVRRHFLFSSSHPKTFSTESLYESAASVTITFHLYFNPRQLSDPHYLTSFRNHRLPPPSCRLRALFIRTLWFE